MVDRGRDVPSPFAGRYEIQRELGHGASATVVLATDLEHDREVALKILHADYANALGPARFLREIRLATRLQHPYIVPVLDSGEWEGWLFIAMPVIDGAPLRARMARERQLQVADAVRFTCEIADALQYAHDHGVLHRDVKPENILVSGSHACLADFGIARALTPGTAEVITSTGVVLGTPAYMSPEQGSDQQIDGRSDQYSLACVLYEMLAGIPPFVGPSGQSLIMQRLANPAPPVRHLRPSVGRQLEAVVARALQVQPADRYASVKAFADALKAASETPSMSDIPALQDAPAFRGLRKRTAMLAGALGLTTVVALGAWWGLRDGGNSVEPGLASLIGDPGRATSPPARDLYLRARQAFAAGQLDRAEAGFASAAEADPGLALASLWQAQLIQWRTDGGGTAGWLMPATRAMRNRAQLSPRDAQHALALVALGEQRYPDACRDFGEMVRADSQSFPGWFGLGECRRLDRAVVRDSLSPSRWRFRAELSPAIRAYTEALAFAPGEQVASAFERASRVFFSTSALVRSGRAVPPDSGIFMAYPALVHDSLAFIPFPQARAAALDRVTTPPSRGAGLRRMQEMELAFVRAWIQRMPGNVDALAVWSLALESRGEIADDDHGTPDALSLIREARRGNVEPRREVALQAAEVRLLTKSGRFAAAGRLADSALRSPVERDDVAGILAALGALAGRESLAALHLKAHWLSADRAQREFGLVLSPAVLERAASLFAAVETGHCDSLHLDSLERKLQGSIATTEEPRRQEEVSTRLLGDVLLRAVVCTNGASVRRLPRSNNPQARLARAAAGGDSASVAMQLAQVDASREGNRRANLSWDVVALEAWSLAATGAVDRAAARLESSLEGLPYTTNRLTREPRLAAGFRRTLQLRVSLATQMGDSATAHRWRAALKELSAQES